MFIQLEIDFLSRSRDVDIFQSLHLSQGDAATASDPLSIETCGCTVVPGSLCVAQIWIPEPGWINGQR